MRKYLICILFLGISFAAIAQPKVAVLDAVIHSGVNDAVQVPVTQNIIEELVASGKYTVLDRAHVEQSLKELEFQVSGVVKDADIKRLGDFLGAQYIVIIDISIIEDIYFVSAKLIEVESSVIKNQVSHKDRGDISVIFEIASVVGEKLSGKEVAEKAVTSDTSVLDSRFATVGDLTYKVDDEGITFYAYDVVISGMKGRMAIMEFQLSQGSDWLTDSIVSLDPVEVIYDPAYWNGEAFWFYYPFTEFYKDGYGDYTKEYWGSFFIVDDSVDGGEDLLQKDIKFTLPGNITGNSNDSYDSSSNDYQDDYSNNYDYYDDLWEEDIISRILVNYNWVTYVGEVSEAFYSDMEYDANYYLYDFTEEYLHLDIHALLSLGEVLYLSGLFGFTNIDIAKDYPINETANVVYGITAEVGGGVGVNIEEVLQSYLGLRVGLVSLTSGDFYTPYDFNDVEQSTMVIAVEFGIDLIIDVLAIGVRLDYEFGTFEPGDLFLNSTDFGRINIALGAGLILDDF